MQPCVLFRSSLAEEGELDACQDHFTIYHYRHQIPPNSLVIPRYSALPYYQELVEDMKNKQCQLINSYEQHRWIANFDYYDVLKDFTPQSWDDNNFYLCQDDGPFIVKGRTNSKKMQWSRLMFAKTKRDALKLAAHLMEDSAIGEQGIIYRKFIKFKTYEYGLNDLPFTNEWRFFYYKTHKLASGYYWTIASRDVYGDLDNNGINFAQKIAEIVSKHVNFFVLDIAQKEDGEWILVEINDGQMSGLSDCPPYELYSNLRKQIYDES